MTKGIHVMHEEAERLAVKIGPRISDLNGNTDTPRAAYYLTKRELRNLFAKNGFNTNGVSWLKMIIGWREVWEEMAPSNARILDKNDNMWNVYFVHINEQDLNYLRIYGESKDTPIFAAGVDAE